MFVQNELLPASERIPPHTRKKPTGAFDRSHLLQHLKTQAAESKIGEDYVPFVKKTPKEEPAQVQLTSCVSTCTNTYACWSLLQALPLVNVN